MAINIEPAAAVVPASGGVSNHVFSNPGEQRLVFKVDSFYDYFASNPPILGEGNEQRQLPREASLWISGSARNITVRDHTHRRRGQRGQVHRADRCRAA